MKYILKKKNILGNILIIILNQEKNLVIYVMIQIVIHVEEIIHLIVYHVNIKIFYLKKKEKYVMKKKQI